MNSLGQQIREIRLKKGLTQIELANGLCTPSLISQVESNRARPSYKTLVAIADRLEVPLEHLLKGVNFELEFSSKYKMAMSMVHAREFETAIPILENLIEHSPQRIPKEKLQLELAICHLEMGRAIEAEKELNLLLNFAKNNQNETFLPVVLLNLGKVMALKGDYPIALFHTQCALDEFQKEVEHDPELHSKVLMQLASLNERIGKVSAAIEYYERALLLNLCSSEERGRIYLRLAEVYDRQKKYEQAEDFAVKASLLFEDQKKKHHGLDMQHRLIMLKRSSNVWEASVQDLLSLAEQYERDGKRSKAGTVFADIAQICLENGELDESWAYAEKARLALQDTDPMMGKVHRVLAFVYFHRKDEKKGQKHLTNASIIFEQHALIAELEEVTHQMCQYLNSKGEHQEAFAKIEHFHEFLNSQLEQRGIVL